MRKLEFRKDDPRERVWWLVLYRALALAEQKAQAREIKAIVDLYDEFDKFAVAPVAYDTDARDLTLREDATIFLEEADYSRLVGFVGNVTPWDVGTARWIVDCQEWLGSIPKHEVE